MNGKEKDALPNLPLTLAIHTMPHAPSLIHHTNERRNHAASYTVYLNCFSDRVLNTFLTDFVRFSTELYEIRLEQK